MPTDEFGDIPDDIRAMTQAELEVVARVMGQTPDLARRIAYARVELLRRDREYAEKQEHDRREFEREMSAAADAREARRQKSDEELAQRQMGHAATLAKEQLDTAQAAARAAKWAAGAAVLACISHRG
jgi:hypothetical protein